MASDSRSENGSSIPLTTTSANEDDSVQQQKLEIAGYAANDVIKHSGGGSDGAAVQLEVDIAGRLTVHRPDNGARERPSAMGSTLAVGGTVALTKEELLKNYAKDSTWMKIRWLLLFVIAFGWLAMLGGALAIIIMTPKCAPQPELDWWQSALVYCIEVKSFQDTDGDGYGDLKGVQRRLSYVKKLEASAISLGSIFSSSDQYGNDVIDHMAIDPRLGTLTDFQNLVKAAHKQDLKILVDIIPNHTSRQHPWFNASRHDRGTAAAGSNDNGKATAVVGHSDFYLWASSEESLNKKKSDGQNSWTYDNLRKQYYFHSQTVDQPDLNLRSQAVLTRFDEILEFWLDRGVDGFIVKSTDTLFDGEESIDQNKLLSDSVAVLLARWRELLDRYSLSHEKPRSQFYPRILIAEVNKPANQTVSYCSPTAGNGDDVSTTTAKTSGHHTNYQQQNVTSFASGATPLAHLATNMALIEMKHGCHADCVMSLVREWMEAAHRTGVWSNWQVSNKAVSRVSSRMADSHYINAVNMLLLTLPGTAFSYYGDEIGMRDANSNVADSTKQFSPMQWDDGRLAGFSNGSSSWVPLSDNYKFNNVEVQLAHGAGVTNVEVYQSIAALRREPSFQWGNFYQGIDDNVLYYVRQAPGFPGFLVAINFGSSTAVDFVGGTPTSGLIPDVASVVATTSNFDSSSAGSESSYRNTDYATKNEVAMSSVYLKPGEGVVFRWEADALVDKGYEPATDVA